jgi:hypothetical protein
VWRAGWRLRQAGQSPLCTWTLGGHLLHASIQVHAHECLQPRLLLDLQLRGLSPHPGWARCLPRGLLTRGCQRCSLRLRLWHRATRPRCSCWVRRLLCHMALTYSFAACALSVSDKPRPAQGACFPRYAATGAGMAHRHGSNPLPSAAHVSPPPPGPAPEPTVQ